MSRETEHTCHATGCNVRVLPRIFMCKPHWFSLPRPMRVELLSQYRSGQEVRMDPTPGYIAIARKCVEFIEAKEGAA